jgi:AraC-like DNA-binding protein
VALPVSFRFSARVRARVSIRKWKSLAVRAKYHPGKLAKQLKLHPRTFQRLCRKELHQTGEQWLNDLRLAEAMKLAKIGTKTQEIAKAVGCKSVTNFCLRFKIFYGKSVRQFRRKRISVAQR